MIEQPFRDLVQSVAAKTPTPGGGSAAGLSACLGTALLLMVVRFSRGKKATLEHDAALADVERRLEELLQKFMPMAQRDATAFDLVSRAYGLPKETEADRDLRDRAIEEGMVGAMVVPEETLGMVREALRIVLPALPHIGRNIVSDLGSGAELLAAAAQSALLNVRINASYVKDRDRAAMAIQRNDALIGDVREMHRKITAAVESLLA
ncbi:MAG: cyclodeaminase/cyclohydrolase family protein [Planctomycetes bacterium]|nr:cyclodeaminase/cyclohydrolase family protein [Planctomycetota bacterium]